MTAATTPHEQWRVGYRPALDGMRGVAIALVLMGHAQVLSLRAASTVGATLFFVLSGFRVGAPMRLAVVAMCMALVACGSNTVPTSTPMHDPNDDSPMTWALLAYRDPSYLDRVRAARDEHGWGVNIARDSFSDGSVNPADTDYAPPTALVLQAFIDLDAVGPDERAVARAWIDCCLSDDFFWYSDQPSDAIYTPNVSALMAGVMQELGYRGVADRVIRRLIATTDLPGWPTWAYSAAGPKPNDMLHHVYTVIGIERYRTAGGRVPIPWTAEEALAATPAKTGLWPAGGPAMRALFATCYADQPTAVPTGSARTERDAAHVVYAEVWAARC